MGERKITRDGKIIQRKEDKMEISFGEYFDDQRDRMIKDMQNKNAQQNIEWMERYEKRQAKKDVTYINEDTQLFWWESIDHN